MTRSKNAILITGIPRLIIIGLLGGFPGLLAATQWNLLPLGPRTRIVPAPYRVPKIPGGTALRLAMVHDVLHERYLRHGAAWYLRRDEIAQATLAQQEATGPTTAPSLDLLAALDDLGVGLERAGQYDQSIAALRKKLALVSPLPPLPAKAVKSSTQSQRADEDDLQRILAAQNLSPLQHHQYTACANLGTVLVHSAMSKALRGDTEAAATVREGLDFIERAIAINPGAHFGRETWQAIAIEHFLAAIDRPELVSKYTLIGEALDGQKDPGRATRYPVRWYSETPGAELTPDERLSRRQRIVSLGIDPDWVEIVHPDYAHPMPFDESTLAIIGMWTLGGGPSPHFALALATTMESIGERQIAWNGYERAVELGDQFWPDPAIRQQLIAHCRQRQNHIALDEDASNPQSWQDAIRHRHQSELAWGQTYQKAYQDYEAQQIAKGVSLDDPHFYEAFNANRPSIASPPGLSDDFIVTFTKAPNFADTLPCVMLGAGLAMMVAVWLPGK